VAQGGGPESPSGFFRERRVIGALQEDHDAPTDRDAPATLIQTENVPGRIDALIRSGKATLHELQTVYSLRDLYDLLEIASIEAYNRRQWDKFESLKAKLDANGGG